MASSIGSAPSPAPLSAASGDAATAAPQDPTTANAWLLVALRKVLDANGDGKLSFQEFSQNRAAGNISTEDQAQLATIDQAAFDAIEKTDRVTDSQVDLQVLAGNKYLLSQTSQYGPPKPSEYLLAAATAGGLVADPNAPTEAEKATISALQDKLAQGGLGSLSTEEQAVVVRAGALMGAVESALGGGATPDPAKTLETLTKHLRYELGYEQTKPNVDPANFDYQSLLAGGTDADVQSMFLYNSVANQYKADHGLPSKTDQSVPAFNFMLESEAPTNVPVTQGGSTESWRPSYKALTPEQAQVVTDWVAANGPITDQNQAEVCEALAQKFPQSGWHFKAKSFPDVWGSQKANIGVLQQAQDKAYREWNPDGTPKISSPEHVAAQLSQQLHLNYGPDGQPELDFQPGRLSPTDREAQAAPATIHDRGEWVWNDPANPPTKTIHHEGAQSAMGPTSDGWDEEVTDDSKVGDLSCGHWNYTPREGAAALPNTSDWVQRFTSQQETLLQAVTVGRDKLSKAANGALGFWTLGLGTLGYTGTHQPEYTPTQQAVIDLLKAHGRSPQNIEEAMRLAHEDWVSDLWVDGSFAIVGVAGAGMGSGAIASAVARGTAGMAARGGVESLWASAARGGGMLLQTAIDPINLLGLNKWAVNGGLVQVLEVTSKALAKLFGPASETFKSLQALFQRASESGSPRELLPLVQTAQQKIKAQGPLSAEQQAVLDQLTLTEAHLSQAAKVEAALARDSESEIPGPKAAADKPQSPHALAQTPTPTQSGHATAPSTTAASKQSEITAAASVGAKNPTKPGWVDTVTWSNLAETKGHVTLNGHLFDVVKTTKGQVLTGKLEQGESRFKVLDATTGRPTGAIFYKDPGVSGWVGGELKGGARGDEGAGPSHAAGQRAGTQSKEAGLELTPITHNGKGGKAGTSAGQASRPEPKPLHELPKPALANIFHQLPPQGKAALVSTNKHLQDTLVPLVHGIKASGADLANAIKAYPNAKRITITGNMTEDQVAALANAKNLKHLDLSLCTGITPALIKKLSEIPKIKELESLKMTITGSDLQSMPEILPMLTDVKLVGPVTSDQLARLSGANKLKALDLSQCPDLTRELMKQLSEIPKIKELESLKMTIHGMDLERLREMFPPNHASQILPMLTDVQLVGPITSNQLGLLSMAAKLKTLDLSQCTDLTPRKIQQLAKISTIKQLESLNIGIPIPCSGLKSMLQSFPMLTDVELVGRVTSNQLALLAEATKLRTLDLSRCQGLTDQMLQKLSKIPTIKQLESLSIGIPIRCSKLESTLQSFPMLTDVKLVGRVTSNQLALLAGATKLKTLDLLRCKGLTDKKLEQLSKIPTIKNLEELKMAIKVRFLHELRRNLQRFPKLTHLQIVGKLNTHPIEELYAMLAAARIIKVLDLSRVQAHPLDYNQLINMLDNLQELRPRLSIIQLPPPQGFFSWIIRRIAIICAGIGLGAGIVKLIVWSEQKKDEKAA